MSDPHIEKYKSALKQLGITINLPIKQLRVKNYRLNIGLKLLKCSKNKTWNFHDGTGIDDESEISTT